MRLARSLPFVPRFPSLPELVSVFAFVFALAFALAFAFAPATRAAAADVVDAPSSAALADTAPTPDSATLPVNAEWNAFCDRLKAVGGEILKAELPDSALDRAEGQRHLLQRLAATIDEVLDEESGPPLVTLYSHKLRKYGMDSADAKYSVARVRGDGTYRLSGTLGTAHHVAFQATTSRGGWQSFESISRSELRAKPSGEFSLLLSTTAPGKGDATDEATNQARSAEPWLRLDPNTTELILREYFYDWASERPSTFRIERLDRPDEPVPLEPAATTAMFERITDQFAATVPKWFAPSLDDRRHRKNQLRPPSKSASEGLRDNAYGSGWFALDEGHALLIELPEPNAHLWSFELGNFWWQSLDYVSHTSSLNGFQAVKSSDGLYRLVVALEDPDVPNWLDPVGHREGTIIYRYQLAPADNATPIARLVALDELPRLLPADTRRITPVERRAEIAMRQRHAAIRFAP